MRTESRRASRRRRLHHDAAAVVQVSRAAQRGGSRAHTRGRRPAGHADRRRHRSRAQHEAHSQWFGSAAGRRAHAYRSRQYRRGAREVPRAVAGGGAGRHPAPAQHGHAGRQPVPGHALHLLQPELRMAQGNRLLHEEGWGDLLGGYREQALSGGVLHRHRARADLARRQGEAGLGGGRA